MRHAIVDDASTGYVVHVPNEPARYFADREDALRYARSTLWCVFDATWEFNFEDPDDDF
jgi:hypothetical protein